MEVDLVLGVGHATIVYILFARLAYELRSNTVSWIQHLKDIVALDQRMPFIDQAYATAKMGHFVFDPMRKTAEHSA